MKTVGWGFLSLVGGYCLVILIACSAPSTSVPGPVQSLEKTLAVTLEVPDYAFLSLWDSSSSLYVVGGNLSSDGGRVGRLDDDGYVELEPPAGPLLWWVHGVDEQNIWMVGDRGRILKKHGDQWRDESIDDEKLVLWGAWAVSANDVWAVGGSVRRGGPKGVILRSNGDGQWRRITAPALPTDLNLYKVWAENERSVFFVGEGGVTLHYDGDRFTRIDVGVRDLLFTLDGYAVEQEPHVLAVGGANEGLVFRREPDGAWTPEAIPSGPGLNGVAVIDSQLAVAVGHRGQVLVRTDTDTWHRLRNPTIDRIGVRTLHAVRKYGRLYAVGGDLSVMEKGIIVEGRLDGE